MINVKLYCSLILIIVLPLLSSCNYQRPKRTNFVIYTPDYHHPAKDTIINGSLYADWGSMEPGLIIPIPDGYKFSKYMHWEDYLVYTILPADSTLKKRAALNVEITFNYHYFIQYPLIKKINGIVAGRKVTWFYSLDELCYVTKIDDFFDVPDSGVCYGTREDKLFIMVSGNNKDSVRKLKKCAENISLNYYKVNNNTLDYYYNVKRLKELLGNPAKVDKVTRGMFPIRNTKKYLRYYDYIEYTWENKFLVTKYLFRKDEIAYSLPLTDSLYLWK